MVLRVVMCCNQPSICSVMSACWMVFPGLTLLLCTHRPAAGPGSLESLLILCLSVKQVIITPGQRTTTRGRLCNIATLGKCGQVHEDISITLLCATAGVPCTLLVFPLGRKGMAG